jgi:hypothetical protein
LEALASGVPVIGADAGGLPEVVTHGVTGFLCGVGDVEAMSLAGAALLADSPRWQAMSAAAADDARRRFSQDAVVAQYEIVRKTLPPVGWSRTRVTLTQAIILGLVQGFAELLPISSSAHLALAPYFLDFRDPGLAFDVALHAGTLVALIWYFRREWIDMIASTWTILKTRRIASLHERRALYLIVATIPAGIAGLLLNDYAETAFRSPALIAITRRSWGSCCGPDRWSARCA